MVPARYTEVMVKVSGRAGKDKFWWRQKMVKSEGSRDMHKRRVYRRHPGSLVLSARESGYGFAEHLRMDQEIDDIVILRME